MQTFTLSETKSNNIVCFTIAHLDIIRLIGINDASESASIRVADKTTELLNQFLRG